MCPVNTALKIDIAGVFKCEACATEIPGCEECSSSYDFNKPDPDEYPWGTTCSKCKGDSSLNNRGDECIINCGYQRYYDANWFCHPFHQYCTDVQNITGDCLACEAFYELDPTTKRCGLPSCPARMWRFSTTVCKSNPPFCVTAEDYTGKCQLCEAPLYEVDPTTFLCRLIPCLANQWRDS